MHIFLLMFVVSLNLFIGFHGKFDLENVLGGAVGLGMLWIIFFIPKREDY